MKTLLLLLSIVLTSCYSSPTEKDIELSIALKKIEIATIEEEYYWNYTNVFIESDKEYIKKCKEDIEELLKIKDQTSIVSL